MSKLLFLLVVFTVQCVFGQNANRPISKVVSILKDMQTQLNQEAKDDQALYEKITCWCTTNDGKKTEAIAAAEAKIEQCDSTIEKLSGKISRLTSEIEELNEEIQENTEALEKATSLRKKEYETFSSYEAETLTAINSLKMAVEKLSGHNPTDESSFLEVVKSLDFPLKNLDARMLEVISPKERIALESFIQQPVAAKSYNNRSGEIFGILTNMLETFQNDLSNAQKEEQTKQKNFEELKAGKEAEIESNQNQVDSKTTQKAQADQDRSDTIEDRKQTRATLSDDEQFLMDLKERCRKTDKEYEQRLATRKDELIAVAKAIEILDGDAAHQLFSKSINASQASFLQLTATEKKTRVSRARNVLTEAGKHSPRIAILAMQAKLNAFTKVKAAIDKMIADLRTEKENEVTFRDSCNKDLNKTEQEIHDEKNEQAKLTSEIADLTSTVKRLTEEIAQHNENIAEARRQLKAAGENRGAENAEFKKVFKEQQQTQAILKQATAVLAEVYAKEDAAFVQKGNDYPKAPAGFKSYEKNSASSGVLSMLEQVTRDSEAAQKEAVAAENDAQATYEAFLSETNKNIANNQKSIREKTATKAQRNKRRANAEKEHASSADELNRLLEHEAETHKSCDFILKNFTVRQDARDEEITALQKAKSILGGAGVRDSHDQNRSNAADSRADDIAQSNAVTSDTTNSTNVV